MHKRIGEFLKEKGLITEAQLDAALRAQLLYGGHVGTCLMELGLIDEDALGEALAQTSKVPYAPPKVLKNLSPKTIKSLPRKLAEKYRAVPISVDEGTVHLCMIDPRDINSLDEIAFATGCRVKPWVSPEARIYQALDRYYGVRRSARYITLCRTLDASESMRQFADPATNARAKGSALETPYAEGSAGVQAPDEAMPDQGGEYGYGRCWKEIAVDIGLEKERPEASPAPGASGIPGIRPPEPGTIRPTLGETTDKLCRTENKKEAVDAVLEFASARMARSIFFGVNDDMASVWDSRGSDFDRRRTSKAGFSVASEKLFELLLGVDYYRGPLPSKHHFASFYTVLGMNPPKELLLFPIHFDDHLVGFFYGDGGPAGVIAGETDEYVRLFRIFPIAVSQIVLKDSMRTIGNLFSEPAAAEPGPPDRP